MAKMMWNLNDFEEVEARYETVKPIRGKGRNAGKVPIACRKRAHEEIVRVNANCYALYDETYWWWREHREKWAEHGQAAILWTRNRMEGTESIRIRNCGVGMNALCRIDFLNRFLPYSVRVRSSGSGRYNVTTSDTVRMTIEKYYLPKNVMHTQMRQITDTSYQDYMPQDCYSPYDSMDVTLTRPIGTAQWELTSVEHKPPRKRVDKEAKKAIQPHIDSFLDWCWVRTPSIIDTVPSRYTREYWERETLFRDDWIAKGAIQDEDAEHRFDLLLYFLQKVKYNQAWNATDDWAHDPKQFRARFNSFINSVCQLTYKTTDY